MALASAAVIEGYHQFHLTASSQWHPSAYLFAAVAPLAAVMLSRPRRGRSRPPASKLVVATTVGLGSATPWLLATDRPFGGFVLGAGDIATAVAVLGAVLAAERSIQWLPEETPEETEAGQAIG